MNSFIFLFAAVNCAWGRWASWGKCSKTCGNGIRNRFRPKEVNEDHGGTCTGNASESFPCKSKDCGKSFLS